MGTIYQIECHACNSKYIGQTGGRKLGVRLKEPGKDRVNLGTALGRHKTTDDSGNEFGISYTITAIETEISTRKALVAFWILDLREKSQHGPPP